MNKTRAAQIWAQLERFLIERCGLPDGRMLERDRPELIRAIGKALTGRATVAKSVRPPLPPRTAVVERVSARAGRDVEGNILPPPADFKIDRTPRSWWRTDSKPDPVLEAMLERSCSRRMGYDGDDAVDYGRR
jgi:hypothetical protein